MTSDRSKPARSDGRGQDGGPRNAAYDARLPNWAQTDRPPAATSYVPRAPTRSVYCEIDGLPVDVELAELSTAGLFVNSTAETVADTEVEVFLRIEGVSWHAGGHVVRVISCQRAAEEGRRPGFALLFTNVDETQRLALRDAIAAVHKQRVATTPPGAAARTPAAAKSLSNGPIDKLEAGPTSTQPARQACAAPKTEPSKAPPSAASNSTAAAKLSAEATQVLQKLRADLRALEHKPPWGVLGIAQGSDARQAKAAFFDASKRYHPHLYSRHGSTEITTLVTELFIAHKRAYTMMCKALAAPPPGSANSRPSVIPRAPTEPVERPLEVPASDPPTAARPVDSEPARASQRVPARARTSLLPESKPRSNDAELLLSAALKHIAAGRMNEAQAEIAKVLEFDPQHMVARTWSLVLEARALRAHGDGASAYAKYLEVLTLDGKHHEALTETKKYGKQPRGKQPSLLGKLFGSGHK